MYLQKGVIGKKQVADLLIKNDPPPKKKHILGLGPAGFRVYLKFLCIRVVLFMLHRIALIVRIASLYYALH